MLYEDCPYNIDGSPNIKQEKKMPNIKVTIEIDENIFKTVKMPRYQPCPECKKGSRRVRKALGGANYHCPNHGDFFVVSGQPIS
jgi:hypothetical protein